MTNEDLFELNRALVLLGSILKEHPEHDQADYRIYAAYEAISKVLNAQRNQFAEVVNYIEDRKIDVEEMRKELEFLRQMVTSYGGKNS